MRTLTISARAVRRLAFRGRVPAQFHCTCFIVFILGRRCHVYSIRDDGTVFSECSFALPVAFGRFLSTRCGPWRGNDVCFAYARETDNANPVQGFLVNEIRMGVVEGGMCGAGGGKR